MRSEWEKRNIKSGYGVVAVKRSNLFYWYILVMFLLLVARYVLRVSVPSITFLLVSLFPIFLGNENQQIAFIMSCIPFSIAFQYKYALLILCAVWLWNSKGQFWSGNALLLVFLMMIWEFLHVFYGHFSYKEYLRGFAELLTLGMVMTRRMQRIDVKLMIRSLAISVVAVDGIMLFMQLQQNGFNITAVLSRSATAYRFGQENMDAGRFALNFNSNNLGFINNLSICGLLFLYKQNQMKGIDIVLTVVLGVFTLMTLSRMGFFGIILIVGMSFIGWSGRSKKQIHRIFILLILVVGAVIGVVRVMPFVVENLLERFGRADVTGGRTSLFTRYMQHSFSSLLHCFFGIGMQNISQKMNDLHGWSILVPHNGLQEVFVAWGWIGVALVCLILRQMVKQSKEQESERRKLECFSPLIFILFYSMAGQFLTSGRLLLALIFAYVVMKNGLNETADGVIGG